MPTPQILDYRDVWYAPDETEFADLISERNNNRFDVADGIIYDRIRLTPGASLTPAATAFFTNVGALSDKPRADTNMDQAQKLPAPEMLLLMQILFVVNPRIHPEDLAMLRSEAAWDFYLGQRSYGRAPLLLNGPILSDPADFIEEDRQRRAALSKVIAEQSYSLRAAGGVLILWDMLFFANLSFRKIQHLKWDGNGLDMLMVLRGPRFRGVQ